MSDQGGDIFDMAKDGTTMPSENPTQEIVSSDAPQAGDSNTTAGTVTTGMGDELPNTVNEKNLGPSFGGMEGKGGKTTSLSKQRADEDDREENISTVDEESTAAE